MREQKCSLTLMAGRRLKKKLKIPISLKNFLKGWENYRDGTNARRMLIQAGLRHVIRSRIFKEQQRAERRN
jgi:hypothetical protein